MIAARTALTTLALTALLLPGGASRAAAPDQQIAWHASSIEAGDQPFDLIAADLDNDGDIDLASTDSKDSAVSIYLGNGDGTFAPRATVKTGAFPRGLVVADFNHDGLLDLAVAATNGGGMFIHDGRGGGAFAEGRFYATGKRPFHATTADWNADGNPDIGVANEHKNVSILLGDGHGNFTVHTQKVGKWPSNLAAADWNEDGHLDWASTNWGENNVSIRFGDGSGSAFPERRDYTYGGHALFGIIAPDLDRDGHADMVWNDIMRDGFWVMYGDGTGDFPRSRRVPAAGGVRSVRAADLDGDGWLDLASADTAGGSSSIALADGHGGFGPTQHVPVGVKPRVVVAADVNGDHRLDLITTNMDTDDLTLLINQGLVARDGTAFDPGPEQGGRILEFADLKTPSGVIRDAHGDVLIADQQHHRIVRAARADGALTTVAGTGQIGFRGDGGPAVDAAFNLPVTLLLDPRGNLLVADFDNNRIRRIDPAGTISTIAGNGKAGFSGDGGPATAAAIYRPFSLALAADGTLYFSDLQNNRIRKIATDGTITTVAGTGVIGTAGDGGPAAAAQIGPINTIAVTADGTLYLADQLNGRVRRIDRGGTMSTVASQLDQPAAIAVDGSGTVYVATASRIASLGPDGAAVTVVDLGPARQAGTLRAAPNSLSVDADGSFLVTDPVAGTANRIARDGTVTRVAGGAPAAATTPHS